MTCLIQQLDIEKCPHCLVDKPNLQTIANFDTSSFDGTNQRHWRIYICARCGGVVSAFARQDGDPIRTVYPPIADVDESIPDRARNFLTQALNSLHTPAGSVMLSASAVDAMLKFKGYKEGNLYSRIDKAKDDHLITAEMAQWAHEVRLDANEQRHDDETIPLPTNDDARKCVDFTLALGQFLYVLPARVERGLEKARDTQT